MITSGPAIVTQYPHLMSIPQNAVDNVDATTVNPAFEILQKTDAYLSFGATGSRPHLHMRWHSNTQIYLEIFGSIFVSSTVPPNLIMWRVENPGSILLDHTNLEVSSPAFSASTAYYVYAKATSASGLSATVEFEISESPPEESLTWKNVLGPVYTHRYLGRFTTDAMQNVREFSMVDFNYHLAERALGTLSAVAPATDTADLTLPGPYFSPMTKFIKFKSVIETNGVNGLFSVQPKSWPTSDNYVFNTLTNSIYLEKNVGENSKVTFLIQPGVGGTMDAEIFAVGFTE